MCFRLKLNENRNFRGMRKCISHDTVPLKPECYPNPNLITEKFNELKTSNKRKIRFIRYVYGLLWHTFHTHTHPHESHSTWCVTKTWPNIGVNRTHYTRRYQSKLKWESRLGTEKWEGKKGRDFVSLPSRLTIHKGNDSDGLAYRALSLHFFIDVAKASRAS